MKRLIVLVELTEASKRLLHLVSAFSAAHNAQVVIIHQAQDAIPMIADSVLVDQIKHETTAVALAELKEFVGEITSSITNVAYKVSREHLSEQISDMHDDTKVDFIFIGTKAKNLPARMLLGSTAVKLADHADKIIIAVPENAHELNRQHLCVSLNKKYPLNYAALDEFLALETNVKSIAFITALTDNDDPIEEYAFLQKASAPYLTRFHVSTLVLKGNKPWIEVEGYLTRNPALLVLQRGPREISDLLRRFFVNRFIYAATRPLVILPAK